MNTDSMPEPESPVGSLMQRIWEESPDLSFEECRQLAQRQLLKAAGRKNYRVTTPGQDAANLRRMNPRVDATRESAKSKVSSASVDVSEPALGEQIRARVKERAVAEA